MKPNRLYLILSMPLALLVVIVSYVGLGTPDFYAAETRNWQVQSVGQDWIDLFLVVPTLLVSSLLASRHHKAGLAVWGGTVLYLLYTFEIYCFDVHFNKLFLLYCGALGLAFYSSLYFFYTIVSRPLFHAPSGGLMIARSTGVLFIFLSVAFGLLWLSEIVGALAAHATPQSLVETGLFTNPVQVIDLSVFLPGMLITGVYIFRHHPIGLSLAPALLSFFVLMDITIGVLSIMMSEQGLEGSPAIALVMFGLAALSLFMAVRYLMRMR